MEPAPDVVALSGWDRAGIFVSGACAVHCTLLPLLIAAIPVLGIGRLLDERVERGFIAATALVGATAHVRAYWRNHRHVAPGVIFATGFSFVVCARLFLESHQLGPYAIGLGGCLAAASHWANLRMCRCCGECAIGHESTKARKCSWLNGFRSQDGLLASVCGQSDPCASRRASSDAGRQSR